MKATLTELRRDTSKLMRAVMKGEEVDVSDYGQPIATIQPDYERMTVTAEEFRKLEITSKAINDAIAEFRS